MSLISVKSIETEYDQEFGKATQLRDRGEFSAARALVEGLLKSRPDDVALWVLLGHLHWEQHNLPDAVRSFRRATEINPFLEIASLGLYHTLWSSDQQEEALEEMKRFLACSHSSEYERLLREFREAMDEE